VGRERELADLLAALDAAEAGHGSLCLLVGEPGVGKTSLAERLCDAATERGAFVARGPCWDAGGAPAYWPWIQVLRAIVRGGRATGAPLTLGRGGAALARLVPELAEQLAPDVPEERALNAERRRFELFDAVAGLLAASAAGGAVVVVLDDLHAADEGSLLLLSFLARHLHGMSLLIVASQRDVGVAPPAAVARLLEGLARDARRLQLSGLRDDAVARMIAHRTGAGGDEALLRSVQRVTAGNPFFVDEIVRVLAADGRLEAGRLAPENMPLPDSVRVALGRRLAPLDAGGRALLDTAAVIGGEIPVALLAESAGLEPSAVLERLEPARRLALVHEVEGTPGRIAFAHALIRETLYRGLSSTARMTLHRTVAEAIERLYAGNLDGWLAGLAFHFMEALPAGSTPKAVDYARRAGERAARQLGHEDAARHFAQALGVLERGTQTDRERCELLLALGSAQRRAGAIADGRSSFQEAAEIARRLGADQLHARAVLGYAGALGGPGLAAQTDHAIVTMLQRALDALGPEPSPERADLLSRLALELYYTPQVERRAALSGEAVRIAAATGDTRSRLIALYSSNWSMLGPDRAEQRRAAADELLELAHGIDDLEMRFSAHHFRVAECLKRADLAGVETELAACGHLAELLHQPLHRWQYGLLRAMRALLCGRAAESERLTLDAYEHGRVVDEDAAANLLAAQLFNHRWIVGRLGELAGAIDGFAEQRPWIPTWRCAAAFLRSEIGELDAAREQLDDVGRHRFADLPRDGNWSTGIALAGYVASATGARDHAAALYELALPVTERVVVVAGGDAMIGPLALPMAALATTLERWDEGLELLSEADHLNARLDARPMAAVTHRERARLLLARGRLQDLAAARLECERALALAQDLGMARLAEQASELLAGMPAGRAPGASRDASQAAVPSGRERARPAVLERTGEVWRVGREPAVTLVRDSKGMGYLARLLAAPGVELSAVELAGVGGADASTAERARLNVTRALRSAVATIAAHDDALGHELGRSILTGAVARYEPAGPAPTRWRVRV
jgi:hypothetical protein